MNLISIVYFLVMLFGLGYTATFFLKKSTNFLERNLMRLGIGLGLFSVLATILNLLHIPLTWWMFLLIALPIPIWKAFKSEKPQIPWKSKPYIFIYIVLILFLLTFGMHLKGAFSYEYLGDGDAWGYVAPITYISEENTARLPDINWDDYVKNRLHRIGPNYPPSYAILLSLPHQISGEMIWTMKFFNALIISLGVIFFYFMVRRLTKNQTIALLSTFVFAMIPSYLTHFIWAHALVVTIFFPLIYCLEGMRHDKRWIYPSILILASIAVIQPIQAIKLYLLVGIYCLIKFLSNKKLLKSYIMLFLLAGFLSLSWWAPAMLNNQDGNVISKTSGYLDDDTGVWQSIKHLFGPDNGSATRAYTLKDFFIAQKQNLINNSVGWGFVISILVVLSLIPSFRRMENLERNPWLITVWLWFFVTFLLVNSMTFHLPFGLWAFRVWMLLAIPVSILAGYTIYHIRIRSGFKYTKLLIWAVILVGILFTSGVQKYAVNTAVWPTSLGQVNQDEVDGYTNLPNIIPRGTRVFDMAGFQSIVMAFDMENCEWCEEELSFGLNILDYQGQEIYDWLKANNYKYLIISGRSISAHLDQYGDKTSDLVQEKIYQIQAIEKFKMIFQNQGMVVLEVK